jgi:uncharacterized protein YbbC (DUF1343 family)
MMYFCSKNMINNIIHTALLLLFINTSCENHTSQVGEDSAIDTVTTGLSVKTGAEQTHLYFPLLKGKKVGVVTNQTGIIGDVHLIDSLISGGINVVRIFAPEHGFRGQAEAGEKVSSDIDPKTGVRVVSLYGNNFKPSPADMQGIDMMIFDIQDVGARFYTYISTMHYIMEACAEADIPLMILDRPNPNGFYVDGPVLEPEFKSFIGMHPIPVVHGMTVGELAQMINGEGWLSQSIQCELIIIPVENYTHKTLYELPVAPSPNLQSQQSIYLYPGLCLFEGTVMSVGRGTDTPFEIFGHPLYPERSFSFTPESRPGFAATPPFMNETCFGMNLHHFADSIIAKPRLEIQWLISSYNHLHDKTNFFRSNSIEKLIGTINFRQQVISGLSEDEIRASWQPALNEFKTKRKQYLLYEDFE